VLKDNVYNVLKWIALVLLPGIASLYFGLGQIWNFPAVEQVVGSITVVDTFLGLLLNKSSQNFTTKLNRFTPVGEFVVKQDTDGEVHGMSFVAYNDPLVLPDQQQVLFNVRREQNL